MNARLSLSPFSIKVLLLGKMNKHLNNSTSASLSIAFNIKILNESKSNATQDIFIYEKTFMTGRA